MTSQHGNDYQSVTNSVLQDLRVSYDRTNFLAAFRVDERQLLEKAQSEPSLLDLVNDWLGRTPGLKAQSFDFWNRFKVSVHSMLAEMKINAQVRTIELMSVFIRHG